MPTEEPPINNVIPFRRPEKKAPAPAAVSTPRIKVEPLSNVGTIIPPPRMPIYPLSLEEILEGLREELLRMTEGGVGRGLPKDATALEIVFHAMFMAWHFGRHCFDPSTGTLSIVLDDVIVKQIEQLMAAAGHNLNVAVIKEGLRIKPSYINLVAIEPAVPPAPDPEPEPPMSA